MSKATTPPQDKNGELERAVTLLKRFRRQLSELPVEWQNWIAESLKVEVPPKE